MHQVLIYFSQIYKYIFSYKSENFFYNLMC